MFMVLLKPEVRLSNSPVSCVLSPLPNTAVNDGKEASSDPVPDDVGILDSRDSIKGALIHQNDRSKAATIGDWQCSLVVRSLILYFFPERNTVGDFEGSVSAKSASSLIDSAILQSGRT